MSSSFGLTAGVEAVRLGMGGGGATASDRLEQLRQAKSAPLAARKPMAAIAYLTLPESGMPAGRRLEGGGFISGKGLPRHLAAERRGHILQTTALVNEAYLRLIDWKNVRWQNRAQFFGFAAQMMRHILVDHARGRLAAKRGAGAPRLSLDPEIATPEKHEVDLVVLDDALNKLAELDAPQSRLIELRYFGGLSIEETAVVMGISPATVKREWVTARAWLKREIEKGAGR